jgi:hypothetical protein
MTTKKRTFTSCREDCKGRRPCICAMGHKAAHICMAPDCVCHSAAGYGLELDGAAYRRTVEVRAGVGVLQVRL